MRLLLAIVLILGGAAALPDPADAQRTARKGPVHTVQPRYYQPRYQRQRYYYQAPGYYYTPGPGSGYYSSRQQAVCEERAFAEDPSGKYAGYPCWAREAFGRTPGR